MSDTIHTGDDARREPRRLRNIVPYALTVLCIGFFSFLSGGYILSRSAPVAIVYLLAAAVWVWFIRRRSRPSAIFLTALGAYGLFVAWVGLSVLWSFGPDLSWVAFDVAALYLAVVAVLGFTSTRVFQLRTAGYGFFVVAVAVAIYALLGKVIPDVVTHAHTFARLDSPIGYWNVLALMMVLGLVVALSLAGDRSARPVWRVLAAAGAVPLCFTFFFTLSRGGWVALAVALVAYFAFTTTRLASFASFAVITAPVAAALWKVRGLHSLYTATTSDALRTAQGHTLLRWVLLALLVTTAAQLVVVLAHRRVPWPRWVPLVAGVAVTVVLVAGVAGGSWRYVEARGGTAWVKDRMKTFVQGNDTTSSDEGAGRLISMNTGRPPLWREALQQWRTSRLLGTGAGTFPFTHYRFRTSGGVVKHAHSEWFNVLSELGVVGLVLFVAAVVLFLAAAIRNPFADRSDPSRPLLVALQAGMVAFVVHISWDWDWDMAAIGVVFFLFAGACASYLTTRAADARRRAARAEARRCDEEAEAARIGVAAPADAAPAAAAPDPAAGAARSGADVFDPGSGEPPPGRRSSSHHRRTPNWPIRTVATAVLVVLAVSWLFPYLSMRAGSAAVAESSVGSGEAALADARRAARLDPLAVDPLITEALVLQQLGRNAEALATLQAAARLQPDNYDVYYQEGVLLLKAYGRKKAAVAALTRALQLNPLDAQTRYELGIATGG